MAEQGPVAARNDVMLVGRVAAPAQERQLPSGDVVVTFRVVTFRDEVDRAAPARPCSGQPVLIDTLDCAGWTAGVRRRARSLTPGDVVQVEGALRRRFWRAGAGAASRCEVEVRSLRRLVRAPVQAARRRAPAAAGPGAAAQSS